MSRFKNYLDKNELPGIKKIHVFREPEIFEFALQLEAKDLGTKVMKWLNKQRVEKDIDVDLDEVMAKKFHINELKAGKMIEIYVRHKAGAFDEKEAAEEMNKVK